MMNAPVAGTFSRPVIVGRRSRNIGRRTNRAMRYSTPRFPSPGLSVPAQTDASAGCTALSRTTPGRLDPAVARVATRAGCVGGQASRMIARTSSGSGPRPAADSVITTATSRTFRCVWLEMWASRSKATCSLQLVSSIRIPLACSIAARLAIAARSWPTSACSAWARSVGEPGGWHSVMSMAMPSTAATTAPSIWASPTRTTSRSWPSARMMRVSSAKSRPVAQAAEMASSTRARSSACWYCRYSSVSGGAEPGGSPWRVNISWDHHQAPVRRSKRYRPVIRVTGGGGDSAGSTCGARSTTRCRDTTGEDMLSPSSEASRFAGRTPQGRAFDPADPRPPGGRRSDAWTVRPLPVPTQELSAPGGQNCGGRNPTFPPRRHRGCQGPATGCADVGRGVFPRIGGHAPARPLRRCRPTDRHLRQQPGPAPRLRPGDRVRRGPAPTAARHVREHGRGRRRGAGGQPDRRRRADLRHRLPGRRRRGRRRLRDQPGSDAAGPGGRRARRGGHRGGLPVGARSRTPTYRGRSGHGWTASTSRAPPCRSRRPAWPRAASSTRWTTSTGRSTSTCCRRTCGSGCWPRRPDPAANCPHEQAGAVRPRRHPRRLRPGHPGLGAVRRRRARAAGALARAAARDDRAAAAGRLRGLLRAGRRRRRPGRRRLPGALHGRRDARRPRLPRHPGAAERGCGRTARRSPSPPASPSPSPSGS